MPAIWRRLQRGFPASRIIRRTALEAFLRSLAEERGTKLKWIAQALRVALTGRTVSPGIDEVMVILGKERVIQRLERAIAYSRLS